MQNMQLSDRSCCPQNRPISMAGPGQSGFSLLELLVVVVILGLLATVVALNVLPAQGRAQREKARADVSTLEQAVENYHLDNNAFPSQSDGLQALLRAPAGLKRPENYRVGGYIRRLPKDPWGNDYQYVQPGQHGLYDILSLGADGAAGGEGADADIGNWE